MNAAEQRHFESLLSDLCDGNLDDAGAEQLNELLRTSEVCRGLYLQYVDMHARLTVHPRLVGGVPLATLPTNESDDAVVMELARTSLVEYVMSSERSIRRRKLTRGLRWLAVSLALLVALIGWRAYERERSSRLPEIRELVGEATIETSDAATLTAASIGSRLRDGEQLVTGDNDSHVVLALADGTTVAVEANSRIEFAPPGGGVHLRLLAGTMEVNAAPQPPDRPLVFATDHARYVVLGTRFRLYRETDASRLELDEGKVRLERTGRGESDEPSGVVLEHLEVTAGHVAVATDERTPIVVTPLAAGTGTLQATLSKAGRCAAFSPDGSLMATGDSERGLKIWTLPNMAPNQALDRKVGNAAGLVFLGHTLIHVNQDGKSGAVVVWRPGEPRALTVPLPGRSTRSRAVSPDGSFVAESSDDGTRVYSTDPSLAQPTQLATLPDKGKAWCLALADGAQVAAAGYWDGTLRVHRLATNRDFSVATEEDHDRSLLESGQMFPAAKDEILGGDLLGSELVFETRLKHTPTQLALSSDGSRLAVFSRKDGLVQIEMPTGEQRLLWPPGAAIITCLKFSRDGSLVLAGLNDRTARMWSIADGRTLLVVDAEQTPHDIAWDPIQSRLLTAGGNVKLWQCELP